jgi:hypothetical protein
MHQISADLQSDRRAQLLRHDLSQVSQELRPRHEHEPVEGLLMLRSLKLIDDSAREQLGFAFSGLALAAVISAASMSISRQAFVSSSSTSPSGSRRSRSPSPQPPLGAFRPCLVQAPLPKADRIH